MTRISPELLELDLNKQVNHYEFLGYPKVLGETANEFSQRFDDLRDKIQDDEIHVSPRANMRLLTVIPTNIVSLSHQLDLAGHRAYLNESEMVNSSRVKEPLRPYALTDVKVGDSMSDFSAEEALERIYKEGRLGFRIVELIALAIHYPTAFHRMRGYYAAETSHVLEGKEPAIVDLYRYGHKLKVKRDPSHINDPEWTTPSFDTIITAE